MNRKLRRFIIGGILLIVVFGFVNLYAYGKVEKDKYSVQLDLGYRYLSEMDYEQAEVIFKDIIDVDDTNYEAYLGLVEVYTAMDEPDMAEEVIEDAKQCCDYGKIQMKVIEAQNGLRQFRSMASYQSGFEAVSGLTDFCVQGLDLFLGWVEKVSTVVDGVSSAWKDVSEFFL